MKMLSISQIMEKMIATLLMQLKAERDWFSQFFA